MSAYEATGTLDDLRYVQSWQSALMESHAVRAHLGRIERDGYTIVEDAIEPQLVDSLTADLARLERELDVQPATNEFEGSKTLRVYNLLVHGEVWQRVPVHESV